jgi:DNA-binding transcriptional ArsR family regulator
VTTTTEVYSRAHAAIAEGARRGGIHAFQARMVLAIAERKQVTTPQQIAEDLRNVDGSQVRRGLRVLYEAGLAEGIGEDGGPRRRGVVTHVRLTADGWRLARWMIRKAAMNGAAK